MAPFIKFKKKDTGTATGEHAELHFVNADFISKAVYDTGNNSLCIFLSDNPGIAEYTLKGKEAEDALAILQKL